MLLGAIVAVVVIVVLAIVLVTFARRRRVDSKIEEAFFKAPEDTRTSQVLQEELSTRGVPPPPPSVPVDLPPAGPAGWVESTDAPPAVEEPPATPVPARGGTCPACGNAMEPLGPGSDGMYCPMCGHKEGGG
jgi:hypothetical protein